MSLSPITVKEGAIMVADAHYASYRPIFKKLLDGIESDKIVTPQLLLMGDVFDLLFAPVDAFLALEKETVQQINRLSKKIEIVYIEGNHDFLLANIFPDILVIPINQQPYPANFLGGSGWLAHGDWDGSLGYKVYTSFIRNRTIISVLNKLDHILRGTISRKLSSKMALKKLCRSFTGFKDFIENRFKRYSHYKGWFIEGHFHQGVEIKLENLKYFNLDSMACNQSYFVVQSNNNEILLIKHKLEESE